MSASTFTSRPPPPHASFLGLSPSLVFGPCFLFVVPVTAIPSPNPRYPVLFCLSILLICAPISRLPSLVPHPSHSRRHPILGLSTSLPPHLSVKSHKSQSTAIQFSQRLCTTSHPQSPVLLHFPFTIHLSRPHPAPSPRIVKPRNPLRNLPRTSPGSGSRSHPPQTSVHDLQPLKCHGSIPVWRSGWRSLSGGGSQLHHLRELGARDAFQFGSSVWVFACLGLAFARAE